MQVHSWAPGHATLFFSVPERFEEPNKMGSIGGGFNFDTGVLSSISEHESDQIFWNSERISGDVSLTAVNKFRELTEVKTKVKINHRSELKIGYGLSTSGAGALGTVIGLNELFDTNLSDEECYKIAHYADVVNHTGLGSVMGQITQGIEIRLNQGGPGVCKTRSIPDQSSVILLMMDKLKTADVLVSEKQMSQVTKAGIEATKKVSDISGNYATEMIQLGKEFAKSCGLMTKRVERTIEDLEAMGEPNVSMAMIGETIVVLPNNAENVVQYGFDKRIDTVVTKISDQLPQIIEKDHRD